MNSKSGEEQKKGHHVRKSPNFDSKLGAEQKKVKMIMLSCSVEYQVKIMHYIGLSTQRKIALYVSFFELCY